jgi:hypothetical protein
MKIKKLLLAKILFVTLSLLSVIPVYSGTKNKPTLNRMEPPFWWTGFKNPSLQLMVYGERI